MTVPPLRPHLVDDALVAYIAAHSTPPDDVQRRLIEATRARTGDAARMQIGSDQGLFFEMLTRAIRARSALEIGTFTGYSALSIARGLAPGGRLICCDVSEEFTSIGRAFWEESGIADRIDLVFIDADKQNYGRYFDATVERLTPTGVMLADNTLWSGRVADPGVDDEQTQAMRAFNHMVARDPRVRCVILPIGDGVTFIQRA